MHIIHYFFTVLTIFTMHFTTKGAGFGQSTSLIVGLGDYIGGELNIEGAVKDIRYSPVEFDGWNQMHWTMPFVGNRFSLVWFSPAEKDEQER